MKKILFVLGTLLLLFNCTTKIRALTAGSKVIDDYVGIWGYESNEKDNDAIIFNLSLRKKTDTTVIGHYCSIMENGNRIDCSDKDEDNINGVLKGDTLFLNFYGFYGKNSKGSAKMFRGQDKSITWELGNCKGVFFLPLKVSLVRTDKNKNENKTVEATDYSVTCESIHKTAKISLPFDFYQYEKYIDAQNEGSMEESPFNNTIYLEDSVSLIQFYLCKEDTSMPMTVNRLDVRGDFDLDLVSYTIKDTPSLVYRLFTSRKGKFIDKLTIFNIVGEQNLGNWYQHTFTIDEHCNITIYNNKVQEDRIIKQQVIGKYILNKKGHFEKQL